MLRPRFMRGRAVFALSRTANYMSNCCFRETTLTRRSGRIRPLYLQDRMKEGHHGSSYDYGGEDSRRSCGVG